MGVPVELVGMTYADLRRAHEHGQDIFVRREGELMVASVDAVVFRVFVFGECGTRVKCLVMVSIEGLKHVGTYTLPRGDHRLLVPVPS